MLGDIDAIVATALAWRKLHPRRAMATEPLRSGAPAAAHRFASRGRGGRGMEWTGGRAAVVARGLELVSHRVCRHRHLPVASGASLRRLGLRPVFYSLFILPLHATRTLWPIVAVQAVIAVYVLRLTCRIVRLRLANTSPPVLRFCRR